MTPKHHAGVPHRAARRIRRHGAWLVPGLLMLALTVVTGWQMTRGVAEFGTLPATVSAGPTASRPHPAVPVGPGGVAKPPAGSSRLPAVPLQPGGLPTVTTVAPTRLAIPALRVDIAVKPVGVDLKTGEFEVPEKVSTAGWYRHGPGLEADAGSVVIAGHVDTVAEGAGPFLRLAEIRLGTLVTLRGDDGSTYVFRVVSRHAFPKSKAPYHRLFARDGTPRLTLVTCGGTFDRRARSYRDNLVVTALPVGDRRLSSPRG